MSLLVLSSDFFFLSAPFAEDFSSDFCSLSDIFSS